MPSPVAPMISDTSFQTSFFFVMSLYTFNDRLYITVQDETMVFHPAIESLLQAGTEALSGELKNPWTTCGNSSQSFGFTVSPLPLHTHFENVSAIISWCCSWILKAHLSLCHLLVWSQGFNTLTNYKTTDRSADQRTGIFHPLYRLNRCVRNGRPYLTRMRRRSAWQELFSPRVTTSAVSSLLIISC